MIRNYTIAIVFLMFLGILSFTNCTNKEINLVTNIDFEPLVTADEEGFVKDSLFTSVGVVPERPYPDFYYYASYEVKEGTGYFVDTEGTIIAEKENQLLPQDSTYRASWKYVGTTVGTHNVALFFSDNYDKRKAMTIQMELANVALLWEARSEQTTGVVKDSIPLQLVLENQNPERTVDFEYSIRLVKGAGQLLDADKKPIEKGESLEILQGTTALFYVPLQGETNTLLFELTDSNGQELQTELSFEIEGESINLPPVANDDAVEVIVGMDTIIDVLSNDEDPEMDMLKIEAIVVQPLNGTVVLNEDGTITYTPNPLLPAGANDRFVYTIKDDPTGNVSENEATVDITFIARETIPIPDPIFEQSLIDQSYDSDGEVNGVMFKDDVEAIVTLDVAGSLQAYLAIKDYSGIEYFSNLKNLSISFNTGIEKLNLDNNKALETFSFSYASVVNFVQPEFLNLKEVHLAHATIEGFDLSFIKSLESVSLVTTDYNNPNFSNLPNLKTIKLSGARISGALNLESSNNLESLDINESLITSLDISNIIDLKELRINDSKDLSCVQVKNITEAASNTDWVIQETSYYSLDCSQARETVAIPDTVFEEKLRELGFDSDGVTNGKIYKTDALAIETLDVTKGYELGQLQIKQFDGIEAFENLTNFTCSYHPAAVPSLTSFDLSKNSAIKNLNLGYIRIPSGFKFSDFPELEEVGLIRFNGPVEEPIEINFSQNPKLRIFSGNEMGLGDIDFRNNSALESISLGLGTNSINIAGLSNLHTIGITSYGETAIDISDAINLKTLRLSNFIALTSLDITKNVLLENLNISENSKIECIKVANVVEATNNQNWVIPSTSKYSLDCSQEQETVAIPDAVFEERLREQGFDSDGVTNGKIYKTDALKIEVLDILRSNQVPTPRPEIKDFTGIESFENLKELDCSNFGPALLNLNNNTKLERLRISFSKVEFVSFNELKNLKSLTFGYAGTYKESLLGFDKLETLSCGFGGIASGDFTGLQNLEKIILTSCSITDEVINVSDNTSLSSLTLSNISTLTDDSIDISRITGLTTLSIGSDTAIRCVQVNNVESAINNSGWSIKDGASYALDCSEPETIAIPDAVFEERLREQGFDSDGVTNGKIYKTDALKIEVLDILRSNQVPTPRPEIKDFTGIESFENLKELDCSNFGPALLNLNNNTKLERLRISFSKVEFVSFNELKNLKSLTFGYAGTYTESLLGFDKLETLSCGFGGIASGDFTGLQNLEKIILTSCSITDEVINVSDNTSLSSLTLNNISTLTDDSIDISRITGLTTLSIGSDTAIRCVQVNNVESAINNSGWSIKDGASYALDCSEPETIAIPDAVFEERLREQGFDSDGVTNGKIYKTDALKIEVLDILRSNQVATPRPEIKDFTGIESFENLKELDCSNFGPALLNLNNNTKLERLRIIFSKVEFVSFNELKNLKSLTFGYAGTYKESLLGFDKLETLTCGFGGIASGDFTRLNTLKSISLTSCDVVDKIIKVSENTALRELYLNDIAALTNSSIDVSRITGLDKLGVVGNVNAITCVQVDNVENATNNGDWRIKEGVHYSLDCSQPETVAIPDAVFEERLREQGFDSDGVTNGKIYKTDALKIEVLDILRSNQVPKPRPEIKDFTGIESFENLKELDCSNFGPALLNLNNNTKLEQLRISFSKVEFVSFNELKNLKSLTFGYAGTYKESLLGFDKLETLTCGFGGIASGDFTGLRNLEKIILSSCSITDEVINVSDNTSLNSLTLNNISTLTDNSIDISRITGLTTLSIGGNTEIKCVQVNNVENATNNGGWRIKEGVIYALDCSNP